MKIWWKRERRMENSSVSKTNSNITNIMSPIHCHSFSEKSTYYKLVRILKNQYRNSTPSIPTIYKTHPQTQFNTWFTTFSQPQLYQRRKKKRTGIKKRMQFHRSPSIQQLNWVLSRWTPVDDFPASRNNHPRWWGRLGGAWQLKASSPIRPFFARESAGGGLAITRWMNSYKSSPLALGNFKRPRDKGHSVERKGLVGHQKSRWKDDVN